ncbi:heme peroxidase [Blastocladiella emersonii ATCC 22665]|nr:heme peroxidase [Blastocladiella emersonii ATCC 22665]
MFSRAFLRSRTAAARAAQRASAPTAAARRTFAAEAGEAAKATSNKALPLALALAAVGAGGYYWSTTKYADLGKQLAEKKAAAAPKEPLDYKKVAADIADLLDADYEDGSYGPILVRLAWHASGTYAKGEGNGGSNGATMRFHAESSDGANNGLNIARDLLEPIKAKYPEISYADLWTLAGVVAIKELGGPSIPWRSGRSDAPDESACPPQGRLPDASKDQKHVRDVFYRMGFDDREIVALLGAHALGRCHTDRSGYSGPWTFSPTMLTNDYYKLLLSETWQKKKWDGPLQYEDKKTKSLMMLPSDMAMLWDSKFKVYVKEFAADEAVFFDAFASAFGKLLELGVKFPETSETITL